MEINFTEFKARCEMLTGLYDKSIGRKYNKDAIGNWVRNFSYGLTFLCYKAGLKGHHILFTHFACDLFALYYVYKNDPLVALWMWFIAHIWDNVDGALARIRNEAHPKWGELDVHLHLIANMLFWIILFFQTQNMGIVLILGARVIAEYHRRKVSTKERYGEKSKLWKLAAYPTDVNIIYLSYVPFAYFERLDIYIAFYAIYLMTIACGQSVKEVMICLKKD